MSNYSPLAQAFIDVIIYNKLENIKKFEKPVMINKLLYRGFDKPIHGNVIKSAMWAEDKDLALFFGSILTLKYKGPAISMENIYRKVKDELSGHEVLEYYKDERNTYILPEVELKQTIEGKNMSKVVAKDMSEQEVIDFLVKCGMWVEDGKIAKSDVDKAVSLLQKKYNTCNYRKRSISII